MTTTFTESGGAKASGIGGGPVGRDQISVDPDNWVETFFRAFGQYLLDNIDTDIYQIVNSFPSARDLGQWMPLKKTLIHWDIDAPQNPVFGFGDNVVSSIYDDVNFIITNYEAKTHILNLDFGVWATPRSGGVTARLRAYQKLNDLFVGAQAYNNLLNYGIELRGFNGGQFLKEEIDDLDVFRIANMSLTVRVFSRQTSPQQVYIGDILQDEELTTVDGTSITP